MRTSPPALSGEAAPDTASEQQRTGIAARDNSGHTCVVGGFPGVDLTGGSVTWSLTRKAASYQAITLHSGDQGRHDDE